MTEMIETVARAIDKALSERAYGLYDYSNYERLSPPHVVRDERTNARIASYNNRDEASAHYERLCRQYVARAALLALRDNLTGEMIAAMAVREQNDIVRYSSTTHQAIWQAAIDPALQTKGEVE